jgi:hypothetical protein
MQSAKERGSPRASHLVCRNTPDEVNAGCGAENGSMALLFGYKPAFKPDIE